MSLLKGVFYLFYVFFINGFLKIRDLSFKYASSSRPGLGLIVSKKYGDGAKEHFLKQIKLLPMDEYLSQYHTRQIINMMDRYYRIPEGWRRYRPYITGIIHTLGNKWREHTFKFHLSKPFYDDPTNLLSPNS